MVYFSVATPLTAAPSVSSTQIVMPVTDLLAKSTSQENSRIHMEVAAQMKAAQLLAEAEFARLAAVAAAEKAEKQAAVEKAASRMSQKKEEPVSTPPPAAPGRKRQVDVITFFIYALKRSF